MPHDAFSPAQIAEAFVEGGIAKTKQNPAVIFGKAVNAGAMLAFGCTLTTIIGGGSAGLNADNPGLVKLLSAAFFPVGLIILVINGQELLTSNMMSMPMALMQKRIPWYHVPLNLFVVFWGNLVGALFWDAILVRYSGILTATPYAEYAITFANTKVVTPQWHQIFLRGIGCNILVCLAVWQATGGRELISKIVALWIPIFVFVCLGFDHVIANMYFIPIAIMFDDSKISTGYYIWKSLIPSLIGNQIGALLLAVPFNFYYFSRAGGYDATTAPDDVEKHGRGLRDGTLGGAPEVDTAASAQADRPANKTRASNESGVSRQVTVVEGESGKHKGVSQ